MFVCLTMKFSVSYQAGHNKVLMPGHIVPHPGEHDGIVSPDYPFRSDLIGQFMKISERSSQAGGTGVQGARIRQYGI